MFACLYALAYEVVGLCAPFFERRNAPERSRPFPARSGAPAADSTVTRTHTHSLTHAHTQATTLNVKMSAVT